jgi:hypothetical protein
MKFRLKKKRAAGRTQDLPPYRSVQVSLLESLREVANEAQQTRQARMELVELQRLLGTKSRKETSAALHEFVDMMENGCDDDDRGCF